MPIVFALAFDVQILTWAAGIILVMTLIAIIVIAFHELRKIVRKRKQSLDESEATSNRKRFRAIEFQFKIRFLSWPGGSLKPAKTPQVPQIPANPVATTESTSEEQLKLKAG